MKKLSYESAASNRTVSIIIATLNDATVLASLLDSIGQQSWPNIEVIVMDGGSSDGTVELIQSREKEIDYWHSEPDSGIYQAWNRALEHATGEYICFLGADDEWFSPDSVKVLMSLTADQPDIVCSKFRLSYENSKSFVEGGSPWSWETLCETMNLSHRGMLHNAMLFQNNGGFNEVFKIAGDYEFLLRCGKDIKAVYHNQIMVKAGADGVSIIRPLLSLWERHRAQRMHRTIPWFRSISFFLLDYGEIQIGRLKLGLKKALGM